MNPFVGRGVPPGTHQIATPAGSSTTRDPLRAILLNSALWVAGHTLTSGGFLSYFGYELGLTVPAVTVLLVLPELVGLCGLLARPLIRLVDDVRQVWLWTGIAARLIWCLIPVLAVLHQRFSLASATGLLLFTVAVAQALQGVSTVAYLTWTSQLVSRADWNRLLSRRQMANLLVLLIVPLLAGYATDTWKRAVKQGTWSDDGLLLAYAVAFSLGIALQLASIVVLWRLPSHPVPVEPTLETQSSNGSWQTILQQPRSRWLMFFAWSHAAAAGLTQTAFFLFRVQVLHIGLGTFYLLENVMRLMQLVGCAACEQPRRLVSARVCVILGWGLVTLSMLGWFLASPREWGWMFLVYVLWGGWAGINVCGPELLLHSAPPRDNATAWGLYDRGAGLLAGLSGLVGGWWLARLTATHTVWRLDGLGLTGWSLGPFQILFLVSLLGRLAAGLCLWQLSRLEAVPSLDTTAATSSPVPAP